jgi:WD40 repeat protein
MPKPETQMPPVAAAAGAICGSKMVANHRSMSRVTVFAPWMIAADSPTIPLKHDLTVKSAVFSPEGARVVTASADGTARV